MRTRRTRHVIGVLLLSVVLATAGCSGLFGGGGATEAPTVSSDYQFQEGESYTYNYTESSGQTVTIQWTVESVESGDVNVSLQATAGGQEFPTTYIEGSQSGIIESALSESGSSAGALFGVLQIPLRIADGRELREGNSWTSTGDDVDLGGESQLYESAEIEITGTSSYAGETCYDMEIRPENVSSTSTACLNADWPFALSFSNSQSNSTFEVQDFERP